MFLTGPFVPLTFVVFFVYSTYTSSDIYITGKDSFPFYEFLFHFINCFLSCTEIFSSMMAGLSITGCNSLVNGVLFRKSFPASISYGELSLFSSIGFCVLSFKLRSLM